MISHWTYIWGAFHSWDISNLHHEKKHIFSIMAAIICRAQDSDKTLTCYLQHGLRHCLYHAVFNQIKFKWYVSLLFCSWIYHAVVSFTALPTCITTCGDGHKGLFYVNICHHGVSVWLLIVLHFGLMQFRSATYYYTIKWCSGTTFLFTCTFTMRLKLSRCGHMLWYVMYLFTFHTGLFLILLHSLPLNRKMHCNNQVI